MYCCLLLQIYLCYLWLLLCCRDTYEFVMFYLQLSQHLSSALIAGGGQQHLERVAAGAVSAEGQQVSGAEAREGCSSGRIGLWIRRELEPDEIRDNIRRGRCGTGWKHRAHVTTHYTLHLWLNSMWHTALYISNSSLIQCWHMTSSFIY